MPRQRSPDREKAEQMYLEAGGSIQLIEIATALDRPEGTIRGWKNKDQWDAKLNGTFQKKNTERSKQKERKDPQKEKEILKELEGAELTEKQRLFCLYYIKNFNATQAAIKAGYAKDSAHVEGSRLLRNAKVAAEIKRLKGAAQEGIFIDAMDVLNKYIQIAFSDITDYVKFGQKEVQVMSMFGPVTDEEGNPITKTVNFVSFKDSIQLDGTLIKEVKQGKEGVSIKFEDKMKALDKLSEYFDLFPDSFRRQVEEEKLKLSRERLELDRIRFCSDDNNSNMDTVVTLEELQELYANAHSSKENAR